MDNRMESEMEPGVIKAFYMEFGGFGNPDSPKLGPYNYSSEREGFYR